MDKYCKNKRCSMDKDKPCPVFDDCDFGIWDIERQKGNVGKDNIVAKRKVEYGKSKK